ncbi:hypothetical protein GDO86_011827 [Hymenochirus boettgeri]|uniref:ELK domain-containing protein n=1 Tax=Hymenochirus boettgeri TaxID=247094 RepID=A0A8T2JD14_9PIPI|nr:hypothetical protein GDO86_011827 [Hymenochirus boettgeri]
MEEEDQERKRKLEAGKAKLAQFRQRKGQTASQNAAKKHKKKKSSSACRQHDQQEDVPDPSYSQSNDGHSQSEGAATADYTVMRTLSHGEILKHEQTYTIEPESEISTTADDYSSEVTRDSFLPKATRTSVLMREEEYEVQETFTKHDTHSSLTRLEVMEDELAGKQQEIEELNRELEEMRSAYGTQGLQQLQEFELAIKQKSDIITQLTANLHSTKGKDEIMREFLELTEQSQKLKISFNMPTLTMEQVQLKELEKKLHENGVTIDSLKSDLKDYERKSNQLTESLFTAEKLVEELKEELTIKNRNIDNLNEDLSNSKQKERQSSAEIKQLMGTVEDLQKKKHMGAQNEAHIVQRMELETGRKLEQLRSELDEMYGQQIVQMKQELVKQHNSDISKLITQHKEEIENISNQRTVSITNEQINTLTTTISELKAQLQCSKDQKNKLQEDFSSQLKVVKSEKSSLQHQIENLLQDLILAQEQIHNAKQSITEKESKLNEASSLHVTVEDLKAELAAANAITKDLETKHEAEITNYKIKLDMLEREKDAVLDRMAESQEAELEKLRTNFLFSQEEELSKLREDLTREHTVNIENLKQNLDTHYKQIIDKAQQEMNQTVSAMQSEKDSLITKQNYLMLEISKLKDFFSPRSEEVMIQVNKLQKEIDSLRKEEGEKGTTEQSVLILQLKIKVLEKELKEKDDLNKQIESLKLDNRLLRDENSSLQTSLTSYNITGSVKDQDEENTELKNEIEELVLENKQLRKIEIKLKEEIEQQKNTFSFAEKNFEVNFHELQEEYACLLKIKEQLEDRILKKDEEQNIKLQILNEELTKLKFSSTEEISTLQLLKHCNLSAYKPVKADTLVAEEVVEKDATELMEKLEIAQRDKKELSSKLFDLSEQMQLKQNEINQLKEHVKSLCLERDNALSDRQKLEKVLSVKEALSVQFDKETLTDRLGVMSKDEVDQTDNSSGEKSLMNESDDREAFQHPNDCSHTYSSAETCVLKEGKTSPILSLHEQACKLEITTILLENTRKERDQLQLKLNALQNIQADMSLQLEAQRISLTQIHSAHLELVSEKMQREKENELCSLKEEILQAQEQKIMELQNMQHQPQLQEYEERSCQSLIQLLMKRISEEQDHVQEPLIATTFQSEEIKKLKIEFSQQRTHLEEKHSQEIEHLRVYFQQQLKENEERYTMEIICLQEQIQNVSETSLEFCKLSERQSGLEPGSNEASLFKSLSAPVVDNLKMEEKEQSGHELVKKDSGPIYQQLQILRQALYARYLQEVSALKKQHETELVKLSGDLEGKYEQEIEDLKQQIKQLAIVKISKNIESLQLSPHHDTEERTKPDINQLLEEQYQRRIEEEIAKVIVQMTIAFVQKSELARLSEQEDEETRRKPEVFQDVAVITENKMEKENLHLTEFTFSNVTHLRRSAEVSSNENLALTNPAKMTLCDQQGNDLCTKEQDTNSSKPSQCEEKTFVLKEVDYHKMLAMGAENAKLKSLYEERVEDMRQELVRLEQEHQQTIETLKHAHMAQMERVVYEQEQLLSELHAVRAQMAENASSTSESHATERENLLLEELQSLKRQCTETREKNACTTQDTGSQTLEGHVPKTESKDDLWEGADQMEEGKDESTDALPDDPVCERRDLIRANKQLLKILLEVVKTTGAMEETIGRHFLGIIDKSGRSTATSQILPRSEECDDQGIAHDLEGSKPGPVALEGSIRSKSGDIWAGGYEEELDLPVNISGITDTGLSCEDEAQVINISIRLQTAVENILEAINETSNQLEHAKAAQTELVRESFKRKEETADLLRSQEELQERLNEEAKSREHLALELSRAEGLLDGYADERVFLEKQMQEKNDLIRQLEQELQSTGNRLQELEQERQQLQEERELLSRQQTALKADASSIEQKLLEETEKLLKEKIEVQRQAEKDSGYLHKQVKSLESELEDQMNRFMDLEQEKNSDLEDLCQKNISLEKQLEKTRKFLDEQAVDREHERDVFQQEIVKLEQQLKMPQRHQPVTDHQSNAVEKLESNLKEKTDKCSELLLCKEQLQRDIQERNEEIEKLECRIRELEQALLLSDDTLRKVELRRQSIVLGAKGEMPLEAQLQVERDAIDRKENEITNLEEQLEQFREELENKNEEVQQLHMQLEIQRKESATRLQEMEQENKILKDENMQHGQNGTSPLKAHQMKPREYEEMLMLKEQEIDHLNEQIVRLQAQLEATTDNKDIEDKNDQIKAYKSQIKCLKSDQERLKRNSEEEIEKLNEIIEKLQAELDFKTDSKVSEDLTTAIEAAESSKYQLEAIMAEKDLLQNKLEISGNDLTVARTTLNQTQAELELVKTELENLRGIEITYKKQIENQRKHICHDTVNSNKDTVCEGTSAALPLQATIDSLELQLLEVQQALRERDIELLQFNDQVKLLKEQTEVIEELNEVIRKLQLELAEKECMASVHATFNSTSKTVATKDALFDSELEETRAKLNLLKVEMAKLKNTSENSPGNQIRNKDNADFTSNTKVLEEALRDKTAELLANQALLSSVQDAVQSTVQNLESQLRNLTEAVREKDSKLLMYADQIHLLEAQAEEIKRLNDMIEKLQGSPVGKEDSVPKGLEKGKKDQLKHGMQNKLVLKQEMEFNGEDATILHIELEKAKAEVDCLRGELAEMDKGNEKLKEELIRKSEELLAHHTLSASSQEAMQITIDNMESQLQELQAAIKKKDLELLQFSDKIIFFKGQVETERNHHDEIMSVMEDTLREKVAAALVSEAQMKAIQMHSNLMQKADDSIIFQKSKGNQTLVSKSAEEEEAESKISVLSLRILQLEKQLSDLHEQLQLEKEHVINANQHIIEKEKKLDELQQLYDYTKGQNDQKKEDDTSQEGIKQDSGLPTSHELTDATSSDACSDWAQEISDSNGMRGEEGVSADFLPNNIKNLLRAVHQEGIQVLSLTESDSSENDATSFTAVSEPWIKERKALLETILSLKDLIGKMQTDKEIKVIESSDVYGHAPDWRGELLRAIQEVFYREQDVLLSTLHTQLASLAICDADALMNEIQHRLQEQGMEQINAMDCIQNADRRSLLLEIQDLRSQLISLQTETPIHSPLNLEEEELNHSLEQLQPHHIQDMHLQLNSVKLNSVKASELEGQLNNEKHRASQLNNELAQNRMELQSALQIQHKHFKELESLRLELKQRSDTFDSVSETLANEQKKTRELQWALEKEKSKVKRSEREEKEEIEDLKLFVDTQSQKIMEINSLLEREKKLVQDLQDRIASMKSGFDMEISRERSKVSELQSFLEEARVRCKELQNTLDCRQQLDAQLQKADGKEQFDLQSPAEDMLKDLQSQLDLKHHRIVELVAEMEAFKRECFQLRQCIEEEKQNNIRLLDSEKDSSKVAHAMAEELKVMVEDLQQKLHHKTLEMQKLKADERSLKETINKLESSNQQNAAGNGSERRELKESTIGWRNASDPSIHTGHQQKAEDWSPFNVETIKERLQRVSDKLKHLSSKANQGILFDSVDHEDFSWSQNSIQDVISQLGQVAVLSLQGENLVLPHGMSSNTLTEKLLTQNAELTGYVGRLTEEKNDLRNAMLRLEEEASRYRPRGTSGDHPFGTSSMDNAANIDVLIASERELWNRERLKLQMTLKQTEAELSKVKAELRSETLQRDMGRESEGTVLKRVYSKYLRAESFRKALVYQKKYLLLLLGGFQECEEATLALIARMGGQPNYTDLEVITHHTRAFTRFRSAVRVSIAISRMKFLVRRWQRATGSSPSSMNRNGFGQITGNELRTDSSYPQTGNMDLYEEQRHSACRSRSGFDSPQSTMNSHNRHNPVSVDMSPCSHLRHYDPDRALTDYITRLEALQKRLGSVQTGSGANNTAHYSTRR